MNFDQSELFDEEDLVSEDLSDEKFEKWVDNIHEKLSFITFLITNSENEKETHPDGMHPDFVDCLMAKVKTKNIRSNDMNEVVSFMIQAKNLEFEYMGDAEPLSEEELEDLDEMYKKWKNRFMEYGCKQVEDLSEIDFDFARNKVKELV